MIAAGSSAVIHVTLLGSMLVLSSGACDEFGSSAEAQRDLRLREQEQAMDAACKFIPAPRWVVRDKDGKRVPALVEPRCGRSGNYGHAETLSECWPRDFGASDSFPCVRVIDHAKRYINLQYELATGKFGRCQDQDQGDLNEEYNDVGVGLYIKPNCEGDPYGLPGVSGFFAPEFTVARAVYPAAGQWWYPSEDDCVGPVNVWKWSNETDSCYASAHMDFLCVMKPVPEWVVNLLPNPPYTMAVEYD